MSNRKRRKRKRRRRMMCGQNRGGLKL